MSDFVTDLFEALPEGRPRLAAAAVLERWGGCSVYLPSQSKKARRVRAAENMLANGMQPGEAAEAIRERFRVSQRTAQRDVSDARKMSSGSGAG